jgi:hypothetical protein
MVGHYPVGHGKSEPTTPVGWVDYWTDYYNRSRQLKGQPGELERHPRSMEEKACPREYVAKNASKSSSCGSEPTAMDQTDAS